MSHKLGCHWIPAHNRQSDRDYIRALQPPVVKILDPDVQQVHDITNAAPDALVILRDWALSEQKADMVSAPEQTGKRHAQEWALKLARWREDAQRRGLTWPREVMVLGINEPEVWAHKDATVRYTLSLLSECTRVGIRCGALNLSVGWPANTGEGTPVDWRAYAPIEIAIRNGNHALVLHEYWDVQGPGHMWRWWAGRYEQCPWRVPIIIGECGIDRHVALNLGSNYDARGWRAHLTPDVYADQLWQYVERCERDPRIVAVLPFTSDGAREWTSFDVEPAYPALLATVPASAPVTVHLPTVGAPQPPPQLKDPGENLHSPDAMQADLNWQRSIDWVLRWEGGFQANPADKGNYYNGQLIGTKYGISAAVWGGLYDIPNLTIEQAKTIYYQHYWQASGAHKLPWPLCLLAFDTAVLHGAVTASAWLREVGPNPYAFAAKRLTVYRKADNGDTFWRGWIGRVADLLREVGA